MIDVGLSEQDIDLVISVFTKYPEVREAIVFGSRAKGNYKNGSDVDVALKGDKLSFQQVSAIGYVLNEETNLPYKFDILNYNQIKNDELKQHIDRVGVCFYRQ